eukprot:TRINITY_DN27870_c0_g2_i1.p1 TRINITY_DN27870_c0_g2~~TRINITY_DN27870_c0_g2_i1.p1  ORF type:complete len:240 (+),score=39.46 TRINITY_DN27870_c0_g2_i1:107-721(+)
MQAWRKHFAQLPAELKSATDVVRDLSDRSERARRRAIDIRADECHQEQMVEQLSADFKRLAVEEEDLCSAIAEQRRRHEESLTETWDQAESVCLARRLEADGLKRSIALTNERLRTKVREAHWWHENSSQLAADLNDSREQRRIDPTRWGRSPTIQSAPGHLPWTTGECPPVSAPTAPRSAPALSSAVPSMLAPSGRVMEAWPT